MGEAIKDVKEKVQTPVIATVNYTKLLWTLNTWRWCGVCVSLDRSFPFSAKGVDGLTSFQHKFQRTSHPESHALCVERKSRTCKPARRRYRSQTISLTASSWASIKGLRSSSLEHLLAVWCAELSSGGLVHMPQIHSFSKAFRGTLTRLVPDDEPREPREPGEQPLTIDVRLVHAGLPPISTGPSNPRRVHFRNSVELVRHGRVHAWLYEL